jgi:large subunit ribosomal protein L35
MPKMKTNRSAAKRFVSNGNGKFKRHRQNLRHILTKKSPKRKHRLGQVTSVNAANLGSVKRMLPYG